MLFPMISQILHLWEEMVKTRCAVLTKCLWGAHLSEGKEPVDRARQAQGIAFRLQRDSPRAQIFPNPYASAFCYHLEKKARALLKGLTFIVAVLIEIISRLLCVCALRAGTALGSTPCTYEICYTCWQNITTLGGIKDSLETSSALTLVCIRINTADVNAAGLW